MARKQSSDDREYARLVREQERRERKNRRIYGPPREIADDNEPIVTVGGPGASTTFFRAFFGG